MTGLEIAKYFQDFDFELEFLIAAHALHVWFNAVEECLIRIWRICAAAHS